MSPTLAGCSSTEQTHKYERGLKGGSKALYKAPKTKFKDNFKNFQSHIDDVGFSKGKPAGVCCRWFYPSSSKSDKKL